MDYKKLAYFQKLQNQVQSNAAYLAAREKVLNEKQRMLNQGIQPNTGARTLKSNLGQALDPQFVPGNVGDINSVYWPFWFRTGMNADGTPPVIAPGATFATSFSITQEASFIWMSWVKTVYQFDPVAGTFTYIDPDQPGAAGAAFNLSVRFRDGVSSRDFSNANFDLNSFGHPRFPMKHPKPSLFLPNGIIEVTFQNDDLVNQYVPFITAFGYRMRIENSQNILSMVTGG